MSAAESHPKLSAVRTHLRELHRFLLALLKKEREGSLGKTLQAAEWFQILLAAPEYQWLKPLNSLLSDLDALSEHAQVSGADLIIVRLELERFFFKEDGDVTSFNFHYRKLFKNHHDVMFIHGQLRQAFAELPHTVTPPSNAESVRLGWHKTGASKRKLLN